MNDNETVRTSSGFVFNITKVDFRNICAFSIGDFYKYDEARVIKLLNRFIWSFTKTEKLVFICLVPSPIANQIKKLIDLDKIKMSTPILDNYGNSYKVLMSEICSKSDLEKCLKIAWSSIYNVDQLYLIPNVSIKELSLEKLYSNLRKDISLLQERLLENFDFIFSRGHDGNWIEVIGGKVNKEEILTKIRESDKGG